MEWAGGCNNRRGRDESLYCLLAILTTPVIVGKIANMKAKAQLLMRQKDLNLRGEILEMVVWKVPEPVPPSAHRFKYRLVYIRDGRRIVGFDNERGKGDHMHVENMEFPYTFRTMQQLLEDFLAQVEKRRAAT